MLDLKYQSLHIDNHKIEISHDQNEYLIRIITADWAGRTKSITSDSLCDYIRVLIPNCNVKKHE